APSSVVVDATAHTVTLTLANAVLNTDTVLVSYTPGVNKIEDIAGNAALALTSQAVTNNTPAAASVLAWISHDDFVLGQNGVLLDTKPLITMQIANTVSDTGAVVAVDPNAILANIAVLDPVSNGGMTDGTKPATASWDPLQFNVSSSTVLVDTNPSRPGTQIQIVIDISHAGVAAGGFNGYMKFISQSTIDSYAAANITLTNLDGNVVTHAGWYDFTQRVSGGDGAKFVTTGGHITAIVITITDNAFGDSDPAVGHVYDPGVPVLYSSVSATIPVTAGELNASRIYAPTFVDNSSLQADPLEVALDTDLNLKDKDFDSEGFAGKPQFVRASLSNTALKGSAPLAVASPQAPEKSGDTESKAKANNDPNKSASEQGNQAGLRNTLTPPDVIPTVSGQVNYDLPRGTFTGGHGALTLVATQKDGAPLPAWVKFDSATGKVTANVPAEMQTPLDIKVQATDSKGDKAETNLKIKPLAPRPQSFTGKPPLSAQIESIVRLVA
ncbi:SwmB domain-containing protein, partial [Polynucleobacter sp. AP-RePozz3-80-G7]|uniref:SwmB domain-containing protein n=1 Tax=Polynucleobacter sp. AP-RePozz3-80-G7 TaxID=2689105 RepID=UPI001D79C6C4